MELLCVFLSLVLVAKCGYHEEVGIPLAAKIKAFEDKLQNEVPDMESRISGGEFSPVFDHPFLVVLNILLYHPEFVSVCGSSLVSKTRLVTAAHCLYMAASIEAVIGFKFLNYGGIRMSTKKFVPHPNFNRTAFHFHDIAIVFLPQPVEYNDLVQPLSLPNTPGDSEVIGELAMAVGWGITSDAATAMSLQVNQVRLEIVPEMECVKKSGGVKKKPDGGWVCTSGAGVKGTCGGDSGGPLYVDRNSRKILVGVISFSSQCTSTNPSGYTRVASYLGFINQHL